MIKVITMDTCNPQNEKEKLIAELFTDLMDVTDIFIRSYMDTELNVLVASAVKNASISYMGQMLMRLSTILKDPKESFPLFMDDIETIIQSNLSMIKKSMEEKKDE
jgi:hypothetical protein